MNHLCTLMLLVWTMDARNLLSGGYYWCVTYQMALCGLRKEAWNSLAWHKRLSQGPTNYLSPLVYFSPTILGQWCSLSCFVPSALHMWFPSIEMSSFAFLLYQVNTYFRPSVTSPVILPHEPGSQVLQLSSLIHTQIMGFEVLCLQVCLHEAEPIKNSDA